MFVIFKGRIWEVVGDDGYQHYFLRYADNKKISFFVTPRRWETVKKFANSIYLHGLNEIIESCKRLNNNINSFDDNDYFQYALKVSCKPSILMKSE